MLVSLVRYKRAILGIGMIFLFKMLLTYIVINYAPCYLGEVYGIAILSGFDHFAYIQPIENYIQGLGYQFMGNPIGRVPYIGVIYYPFRLLFSQKLALSFLVLVQLIFSSVSLYCLSRFCVRVSSIPVSGLVCILLGLSVVYLTYIHLHPITESLSMSFLSIFFYTYYDFLVSGRTNSRLLLSGLFLALSTLFRPFIGLLFVPVGLELVWHHIRKNRFSAFYRLFLQGSLLLLPLVILNAPWTIRNYLISGKFIPFQEPYGGYAKMNLFGFRPPDLAVREFIRAIGEKEVWWEKGTAGYYFFSSCDDPISCDYVLPQRTFTPTITPERVERLRGMFKLYILTGDIQIGERVAKESKELTENYKKEKPFYYYIINPIHLAISLVSHKLHSLLPFAKTCSNIVIVVLVKGSQYILHYFILLLGFFGLYLLVKSNIYTYIVAITPIIIIILFAFVYRTCENRLIALALPSFIVGTSFVIAKVIDKTGYGKRLISSMMLHI